MLIKKDDNIEIHSLWDLPHIMLSVVKILIERQDKKTYIIIIRKS
jgi:hypothetical protein